MVQKVSLSANCRAAALIDFAHDGESACAAASQIHTVSTGLNCGFFFFNGQKIRKWKEKIILVGRSCLPRCGITHPRRQFELEEVMQRTGRLKLTAVSQGCGEG